MSKKSLPIYSAEEVSKPTDMFRCEPYCAVISAECCLKRQLRAVEATLKQLPGQPSKLQGDYEQCRKCEHGLTIKRNLPRANVEVKRIGKTRFLAPKNPRKSAS